MNKENCDSYKWWYLPLNENGVKNVCSHCDDRDTCTKKFKKVWDDI